MKLPVFRFAIPSFSVIALATSSVVATDTWFQFGGPFRDFRVPDDSLVAEWPPSGPRVIWSTPLGPGYSGVVVDRDTAYTMFHDGDHDAVLAIDRLTGRTRWAFRYPEPFKGEGYGSGPNATPLLTADFLITLSAGGKLHALHRQTGDPVWSHDFVAEYEAETPWHGFSSSPIAFEETVILPVGGKDGRGLMAFNVHDGRVVWQNLAILLGYSSPILIDVDGQQQLVLYTKNNIVGVDPCDGELLWEMPHRHIPQHNAAMMPLWGLDHILWTSVRTVGEGDGARAFKLGRQGDTTQVTELYWKPKFGVEPYSNAVRLGSTIYTSTGNGSRARFVAIDVATGDILWRYKGVGTTNCLAVGDRLIVLGETGILFLANPASDGPGVGSVIQLRTQQAWTGPALSGTQLFIRDQERLTAFELGAVVKPHETQSLVWVIGKIAIGGLLLLVAIWLWPKARGGPKARDP